MGVEFLVWGLEYCKAQMSSSVGIVSSQHQLSVDKISPTSFELNSLSSLSVLVLEFSLPGLNFLARTALKGLTGLLVSMKAVLRDAYT